MSRRSWCVLSFHLQFLWEGEGKPHFPSYNITGGKLDFTKETTSFYQTMLQTLFWLKVQVFLITSLTKSGTGQLITIPQVPPVVAGTPLTLLCVGNFSSLDRNEKLEWLKEGELISNDGHLVGHPGLAKDELGRIRIFSNITVLNNSLQISRLVFPHSLIQDGGHYNCNDVQVEIKVEEPLLVAPINSDIEIQCDGVDFISGHNQNLLGDVLWNRIESLGNSSVVAVWRANTSTAERLAERISYEVSSTLKISQVQLVDDGVYECSYPVYKMTSSGVEFSLNYSWATVVQVKDKPNSPGAPFYVNVTSETISIGWKAPKETPSSTVKTYSIQYMSLYTFNQSNGWIRSDLINNITDLPATTQTYTLDELEGSNYAVRVVACNNIGCNEGATTLMQTTEKRPPAPILFEPEKESDSVTIKWSNKDLKGRFTSFILKFYLGTDKGSMIQNVTVLKNQTDGSQYRYSYTINNLNTSTDYCYTIQTIKHNITSREGMCEKVRTDIGAPDSPVITSIETESNATDTVLVYFEPPRCLFVASNCLDSYKILYKKKNSTFMEIPFSKSDVKREDHLWKYELSGLELGYVYEIKLAGVVESNVYAMRYYTGNFSNIYDIELHNVVQPLTTTVEADDKPTTNRNDGTDNVIIISVIAVCSVLLIMCSIIIAVVFNRKRKARGNISLDADDDLWIDLNTPLLGSASMGYVENDYENIGIDSWAEHCKTMHANSDIKFTEEYDSIIKCATSDLTWKDSLEPANLPKNRYNNIVAYDHSRVVLKTLPGIIHSDYINANYIDSYDQARAFIATQGPLPNTIDDFWRMVWENNSSIIVMITNVYEKHKKKCEQYWPSVGESKYGRLVVELLGVEEFAFWTIRRFAVKNNKVKRKHHIERVVVQYHYTEWPDHGIPEYTLPVLSFVRRVCHANPVGSGPMIVHCSAGVGRSGTFIVMESMMKQIMQKRTVNVQGFVRHIRSLRNRMVQTEDQYIFIHDALLRFIESGGRTDIQPRKFRTMMDELDTNFDTSGETVLEKQYKTLTRWSPPDHLSSCALLEINRNKNRCLSFIPVDNSSRVKLPKVPGENGSDYINATYLHGHFQNKEFIVTQHPSSYTEQDFWKMVWDQNTMTVVMLSNIGEEDLVTFFRPKGETTDWAQKSSFRLTFADENLDALDHAIRDFLLESKQDDYEMLTRLFSITCWPEAYSEVQTYSDGIFQLIETVNKWHAMKRNQTGPIIVIDKYGGRSAAQFCALYTLYNQYHHDTSVDIYSLAYLYHMKRPGIWETQNDYRLLYNSMLQLCESSALSEAASEKIPNDHNLDAASGTFANVRRVNTLPRSPEHFHRSDTL